MNGSVDVQILLITNKEVAKDGERKSGDRE